MNIFSKLITHQSLPDDPYIGTSSFSKSIPPRTAPLDTPIEPLPPHTNVEEKLQHIQEQNEELNKTKIAMLNLLDDARKLEEDLKKEKEGVEKKVEERTRELREEQARLNASIESFRIGYIMTDDQYNLIMINSAAKRIIQHHDSEIGSTTHPTKSVWSIEGIQQHLKESYNIRDALVQCIKEKKQIDQRDIPFGTRFLHIYVSPIVLIVKDELQILGSVILIEDVTEAKVLQRSRDEFFSIASHELRTPLTAIRGNSSLIEQYYRDKIQDPELLEMIDDIHTSSIRLIDIVNDFLDMSRLELGKIDFKISECNIEFIIDEVLREYHAAGSKNNIDIQRVPPSHPLPAGYADPNRIKQILINLVGNSLKFTESGSITVKTDLINPQEPMISVSVVDTGRGIPEQNQSLLFRKFQQAGTSLFTRDSTKGTGLGLYISKLMIEGMGGSIFLERSEEGKGSTFTFLVPVSNPGS